MTTLLDTWGEELGDDAAHGVLFGLLIARAVPDLAEVVERRAEEMAGDVALANQAAREQWCAAPRDWLREQAVSV